jgi:hypothetical protein
MTTSYETPLGTSIATVEDTRSVHVQHTAEYVYLDVIDTAASSETPNDDDILLSMMFTKEQWHALREAR